jgi:hypothetical protein
MNRTQIYLTKNQMDALRKKASQQRVSVSFVIRTLIGEYFETPKPAHTKPVLRNKTLLEAAERIGKLMSKKAPKDLAANLDAYLYGGKK